MNTSKTLLAILVEKLQKNGGWPKFDREMQVVQDYDGEVKFHFIGHTLEFERNNPGTWGSNTPKAWLEDFAPQSNFFADLSSDYATAIVTSEQYEAALAEKEHPLPWDEKNKPCPTLGAECRGCPDCGRRVSCTSDDITDDAVRAEMVMNSRALDAALAAKNEGWIEWRGGRCPIDDVTEVDIKFRAGGIVYGVEAGKYYWPRTGQEYDIIAYRLHNPQEAEQANADDEADLNDCIGQTPEDLDALRTKMVGDIYLATGSITLNDAFNIAHGLIDAGYRKQ